MVSFNQLPPDILHLVLEGSALAVTLWLCGDKALNSRLSSGLTSLRLSHTPLKEFSLPEMVSTLRRLKRLELHAYNDILKNKSGWTQALLKLPRSLEVLTIDSTDSDQVFLNFETALRVADYYQPMAEPRYLPIASFLPNLQTLNLKRASRGMEKTFFKCLPPSLTALTIDTGWFYLPFMSHLPRSLQYLDANTIMGTDSLGTAFADLAEMPPCMTLNRIEIYQVDESLSLRKLPPGILNLQLLYIEECPPSLIAQLPRSLTKLDIQTVSELDWTPYIKMSGLVSPIESGDSQNGGSLSFWPPGLESLAIQLETLEVGALAALPRMLKSLTLGISKDSRFRAQELPYDLETLELKTLVMMPVEGHFPPHVTRIHCSNPLDPQTFCAALPPSLLDLTVINNSHMFVDNPSSTYIFPNSLTTLCLTAWQIEWFHEIPASVTSLALTTLLTARYAFQQRLDLFSALPRGLKSLSIVRVEWNNETHLLAPFPANSSLTHLNISMFLVLPLESIKRLPRAMKSLRAGLALKAAEDLSSLAFLPPNLDSCDVGVDIYAFKHIEEHWPPTAWRCFLHTAAQHHIPTLLKRLALGHLPLPPPEKPWFSSLFDSILKSFDPK